MYISRSRDCKDLFQKVILDLIKILKYYNWAQLRANSGFQYSRLFLIVMNFVFILKYLVNLREDKTFSQACMLVFESEKTCRWSCSSNCHRWSCWNTQMSFAKNMWFDQQDHERFRRPWFADRLQRWQRAQLVFDAFLRACPCSWWCSIDLQRYDHVGFSSMCSNYSQKFI